jgi:hypothetical protein
VYLKLKSGRWEVQETVTQNSKKFETFGFQEEERVRIFASWRYSLSTIYRADGGHIPVGRSQNRIHANPPKKRSGNGTTQKEKNPRRERKKILRRTKKV